MANSLKKTGRGERLCNQSRYADSPVFATAFLHLRAAMGKKTVTIVSTVGRRFAAESARFPCQDCVRIENSERQIQPRIDTDKHGCIVDANFANDREFKLLA